MAEYSPIVEALSKVEMFATADEDDLRAFAPAWKRRSYRRGEVIFHQDDPGGNLYVLVSGYVNVTVTSSDGRILTLAWVRPGSSFGTISVLDERPQPETVTAGTACEVLYTDAASLRDFLADHPAAVQVLLRRIAARWRSSVEQLQDMAFLDINARLAKVVLNLDSPQALPAPDRVAALEGQISQTQLASLIGASRESVNKALQYFVHQSCIELQDGRIKVLDAERLRSYFS